MANALMATGLQMPKIDTMGAFAQGVNARQTSENNQLTLARKGMENIGAIALGAMGGQMDGPVNPEQFEQGLDLLAEQGLNVEAFRGRPEIAPIAARASLSALQQLQVAQNEREMELALQKFQHELAQASKPGGGASFSQTPVFLVDEEGKQYAAQMSSDGGIYLNGEVLPGIPDGYKIVGRPENFDFLDTGGSIDVADPNTGTVTPGVVKQGSPSTNMDVQQNPEGGRIMDPAAGSPEALERTQADKARETASRQADERTAFVIHHIDQAIEKSDFWTTGMAGSAGRTVGLPPAIEVEAAINPIVANLGFQELQAMRDASPTGGALGAISERELAMLQSTVTSLDPRQGEEQLDTNLRLLKNLLQRNQIYRQLDREGIPLESEQAQAMLAEFPLPDEGVTGAAAPAGANAEPPAPTGGGEVMDWTELGWEN